MNLLHGRVPPPTWRDVAIEEIAADTREGLLALAVGAGLQVMEQPMEAEVSGLWGPRGKHDPERTATRHGTEAGSLTLASVTACSNLTPKPSGNIERWRSLLRSHSAMTSRGRWQRGSLFGETASRDQFGRRSSASNRRAPLGVTDLLT